MKICFNILVLPLLMLPLFIACGQAGEEHDAAAHAAHGTTYTCPMHPQVVKDVPGDCPICGMDLVPQTHQGESIEITEDLAFMLEPTNQTVLASVATTSPVQQSVDANIRMDGIITYDPRNIYSISTRVGGRIEQLFVKYNYQPIRKGQKLMELYSPELVTAQKELLYLLSSAPEDTQLIEGAKKRLLLLGASEGQIKKLISSGEATYSFSVFSPYDGYAISLNAAPPTATAAQPARTASGGGMSGMGTPASAPTPGTGTGMAATAGEEIQLREGMYVAAGQSLLQVANPEQLLAEFNVPAGNINNLSRGMPVTIRFPQLPNEELQATIDFLQPYYERGENFAKVRVYLKARQELAMVGQLVTGLVQYETSPSLWIPREAILDVGSSSVVFIKEGTVFRPSTVSRGISQDEQIQILAGLQREDVIAGNAQFMVDSESFIKVNR